MLFLSRDKSPSLLYLTGGASFIDTPQGKFRQVSQPKWIKFVPLNEPMFAPGLVSRTGNRNEAWGILDTRKVAMDLDVPVEEVDEFLMRHQDFGMEYIAVSEDTGSEIDTIDDMSIVPKGKGYFCKLCDKPLGSHQAVNGHKTSRLHQERREQYQKFLKEGRESRRHINIKEGGA